MSSFDKPSLILREPEDALVWLDAFAAKCRAEKKTDVAATASNAADFQVTDQFLFRCGVESLKKLKSLVAPKELKAMPFKDIEKVLKGYLEPQQRLTVAEQTRFVSIVQNRNEAASDFLARLREAARFCEFDQLKTNNDPEAYMIRLRFIAGLENSEHKMKVLEYLRTKQTQQPKIYRTSFSRGINERGSSSSKLNPKAIASKNKSKWTFPAKRTSNKEVSDNFWWQEMLKKSQAKVVSRVRKNMQKMQKAEPLCEHVSSNSQRQLRPRS